QKSALSMESSRAYCGQEWESCKGTGVPGRLPLAFRPRRPQIRPQTRIVWPTAGQYAHSDFAQSNSTQISYDKFILASQQTSRSCVRQSGADGGAACA